MTAIRTPPHGVAIESARLVATKNDLAHDTRASVVSRLNQWLADCIDLQLQCKQAHWNVKGSSFIALHKLFDDINADVAGFADLLAERLVQLGGVAEGTARVVAERSQLAVYPVSLTTGEHHVAALSDALAQFGHLVRLGIDEMEELGDKVSADVLTEISRGIDKWLWFVEAHGQVEHDSLP
jgi:starvation-inducible DNA-binding protein